MERQADLWIRAQHRLGESVIWHAARAVWFWVDLLDPALWCHDPATGQTTSRPLPLPPPIGSVAATTDPRLLVLAHRGGLSLLDVETGELTPYCDPEQGREDIIYNDIKVDRWGRLWVGTSHAREADPRGALWCVAGQNRWALADAGFAIANGPAFSPDGATMYFNDSAARQTLAYDIRPGDLRARNRRVLRAHDPADGLPDGIVTDAGGGIWSAAWAAGRILRLDSAGEILERISVPAVHVTTLAFGGPDLCDLRITTATDGAPADRLAALPLSGSLFRLRAATPGLHEPLFRP